MLKSLEKVHCQPEYICYTACKWSAKAKIPKFPPEGVSQYIYPNIYTCLFQANPDIVSDC